MRGRNLGMFLACSLLVWAQDRPKGSLAMENPDASAVQSLHQSLQTSFKVIYVAEGGVYVDGGRHAGLAEGTKLVIRVSPSAVAKGSPHAGNAATVQDAAANAEDSANGIVAELKVVSSAETSAVCEVESSHRAIVVGDVASLPQDEAERMVQEHALGSSRQYPVIVSFTEGDPLDEEVRDTIPRPPSPEVNRARGRFGIDYSGITTPGPFPTSSNQIGFVIRTDITRVNGTNWNLSGYWRGRFSSQSSSSQTTIQDLMNRTYHLSMTYANPNSAWVAGFGRMYLPWAPSLDTIDGGYFGRRIAQGTTAGIFAGSTPDPTSWSYNPNRRLAGTFVNFDGGDYEALKYSSTAGFGISTVGWTIDRPFVFTENAIEYQRNFSIYHSFQVDAPRTGPNMPSVGPGISASFLTVRYSPYSKLSFDLNHTYFRDVPTYDPQLIGTGLLDKYLFQGVSGGVRYELPNFTHFADGITLYTDLGRSSASNDAKSSWNTLFGATINKVWFTGIRADVRYSKFDSAFAQGSYRALSLSRYFHDQLRWEVQAGTEGFVSPFAATGRSHFLNTSLEMNVGTRLFVEGGLTLERGGSRDYNQWYTTLGYRFDNREHHKEAAIAKP